MENAKRVNEILSQITAFSKDSYTKRELLSETMKFQKELAGIVFDNGEEITEKAESIKGDCLNLTCSDKQNENNTIESIIKSSDDEKRFWHIRDEIRNRYAKCNDVTCQEYNKVEKGFSKLINDTCGLISGIRGEQICQQALKDISCQHGVLYNVELEYDGIRKEIDAIVITNKCIFMIEVKNSKKNLFIDENGNLIRTGKHLHHDCNIARKMDEREMLLRKALEKTGLSHLKIFKILAFSNPYIDVENKYNYIKICSCKELPYFIDKFTNNLLYSYEDICTMMAAINEEKCSEEYRMSINMDEFKRDFAILLANLDPNKNNDQEKEEKPDIIKKDIIKANTIKDNTKRKPIKTNHKRKAAAIIGLTFVNAAVISAIMAIKK